MTAKNSNARNSQSRSNQRNSNAGIEDVVNENTHTSKRAELEAKTLAELQAIYEQVYQVPANDDLDEKELVELIIASNPSGEPPVDSTETINTEDEDDGEEIFGNADKDKKYPLPKGITSQADWQKHVVVREVPTRVVEGDPVELNGQAKIQLYRAETYTRMLANKYFSEAKINVKVLNKPS